MAKLRLEIIVEDVETNGETDPLTSAVSNLEYDGYLVEYASMSYK